MGNDPLLGHLLNALNTDETDEGNREAALRLLQESRQAFERGGCDYAPWSTTTRPACCRSSGALLRPIR